MQKQTFHRPEEIRRVIPIAPGRQLALSRPLVMGVLNVTPDSFSDGGLHTTVAAAVEHALRMEQDGADIVDIGGESTRPGAEPVGEDKERQRVIPVIQRLRDLTDIPVSIDTYKAGVAQAALEAGADIVNDVSALRFDPDMAGVVARSKAPVVLMHMAGTPHDMQNDPQYRDCVEEILEFFDERIAFCNRQGIDKTKIIIDPGIGFGKRLSDNLEILAHFRQFTRFSVPVIIGASRKSFIGMLHDSEKSAHERLGGSLAAAAVGVMKGAAIVRAHDVPETVEAMKVLQAITETV
ncbi:MAG: dihydropteroate synthase [candidate division Zixibacteria bacterium]|nr:dihydropteroate synthase [candidate division Zixibacteria bacterium]